jgi:hypothetical protein
MCVNRDVDNFSLTMLVKGEVAIVK